MDKDQLQSIENCTILGQLWAKWCLCLGWNVIDSDEEEQEKGNTNDGRWEINRFRQMSMYTFKERDSIILSI